jgi:hypothetical protein
VYKPEIGKETDSWWITPGTRSTMVYKIGIEKACRTSLEVKKNKI